MNFKTTLQGIFLTLLGIVLLAGGINNANTSNMLAIMGILLGTMSLVVGLGILLHRLFSNLHLNHLKQVAALKEKAVEKDEDKAVSTVTSPTGTAAIEPA